MTILMAATTGISCKAGARYSFSSIFHYSEIVDFINLEKAKQMYLEINLTIILLTTLNLSRFFRILFIFLCFKFKSDHSRI